MPLYMDFRQYRYARRTTSMRMLTVTDFAVLPAARLVPHSTASPAIRRALISDLFL